MIPEMRPNSEAELRRLIAAERASRHPVDGPAFWVAMFLTALWWFPFMTIIWLKNTADAGWAAIMRFCSRGRN